MRVVVRHHASAQLTYPSVYLRFFDYHSQPGLEIDFDQITEIYDVGRRYEMPLIQNAANDLFANKIKHGL